MHTSRPCLGSHVLVLWDFEMNASLWRCFGCLFVLFILCFSSDIVINFTKDKNKCLGFSKVDWLLRKIRQTLKELEFYLSSWSGPAVLINYACLNPDLCPSLWIKIRGAPLWFLLWIWPRSIASKRKLCWIITIFFCADLLEIRQDRWVAISAHLITPFPNFSVASFWSSSLQHFSSNFGHWIMLRCPIKHLSNVINSSKVSQCHPARDKCNNTSGSEWYPY